MASLVFELEKYSACSCPACWDPALGIEILNPASECEAWQHAAVEWLWASSIGDVCPGTPLRPRPRMVWCPPTAPRMYQPVNMLSEEIWLMIFFYTSEDFPLLSFSALLELSAVSRMPAKALSAVRAEYLRLLTVNLEVEKQIEMEIDEDIRFVKMRMLSMRLGRSTPMAIGTTAKLAVLMRVIIAPSWRSRFTITVNFNFAVCALPCLRHRCLAGPSSLPHDLSHGHQRKPRILTY